MPGEQVPLTPEQAQVEIARVQFDSTDLYHPQHAGRGGHDERVAEVAALFEAAYPEKSGEAEAESPERVPARPSLPEGVTHDEPLIADFTAFVKDQGLAPDTVQRVLEWDAECWAAKEPLTSEESLAMLRERRGPGWERKVAAANWYVRDSGLVSPAFHEALERRGLGNHPEMVALAADVGERALAQMEEIRRVHEDKAHPYNNWQHPQHRAAVDELLQLYAKVYGRRLVGMM